MITVKLAGRLRDDNVIRRRPPSRACWTRRSARDVATLEETAPASAEIVALVDRLTLAESGSFLRRDGTVHPW